eukprot:scaffold4736_cov434-Prasinococcus_capsulatus_cf.AAC.7
MRFVYLRAHQPAQSVFGNVGTVPMTRNSELLRSTSRQAWVYPGLLQSSESSAQLRLIQLAEAVGMQEQLRRDRKQLAVRQNGLL